MARTVEVRCVRCDAPWPVTSPRVRRRMDARWVCVSADACELRRTELLAKMQAALNSVWALLDRIAAGPDELIQAGPR